MYYSTPLYQFRFKCHLCDNYIEMKTDPAVSTFTLKHTFINLSLIFIIFFF